MTTPPRWSSPRAQDIEGDRFGRLVVQYRTPGNKAWCLCDCGKHIEVSVSNLRSGGTRSCGCLRRQTSEERMRIWNETASKEFAKEAGKRSATVREQRERAMKLLTELRPCPRCSALTLDPKSHERWHQNVNSLISKGWSR